MDASPTSSELDRDECLGLLAAGRFGRLVITPDGGPPVVRPLDYVFDESAGWVCFRIGTGAARPPASGTSATFELDMFDERASSGWSVVVHGPLEAVRVPEEIELLDDLEADPRPARGAPWYRVRPLTMSGRRLG